MLIVNNKDTRMTPIVNFKHVIAKLCNCRLANIAFFLKNIVA